jgi:hypothetical protein
VVLVVHLLKALPELTVPAAAVVVDIALVDQLVPVVQES